MDERCRKLYGYVSVLVVTVEAVADVGLLVCQMPLEVTMIMRLLRLHGG